MKGIKNAKILTPQGFKKTSLEIIDGRIGKIGEINGDDYLEIEDELMVIPGFIDQHVHGAAGYDAMDGTTECLKEIANALAQEGVTAFLATTMTQSVENINTALENVDKYIKNNYELGAEVLGVHLEGPYIANGYIGAQPLEYVQKPTIESFKKYQEISGNNIKLVTLAPEVEGAMELIAYLKETNVVASIGHTGAGYKECFDAVKAGATNVTHTYNAQKPLHHREVGTVGSALLLDELACELICDGIHVSPPAIKLVYKVKPSEKVILVSDAMRAKHMPDGDYELGGQPVIVKNGEARLHDGVLAGSVLKLNNSIKNVSKFNEMPLEEAIKCATINVAKNLGIEKEYGTIEEGKYANFTIVDKDMNVYITIRKGMIIYKK